MNYRRSTTVLRGRPDIAERVGYFFAEFAILEWEVGDALRVALIEHNVFKDFFFRPRDGFTQKLDVVRAVTDLTMPSCPIAVFLSENKSELQTIVSFRNVLAHGVYGAMDPSTIRLTSPDYKHRHELTPELMDEWLDRLEALADNLNAARKRTEIGLNEIRASGPR